MGIGKRSTGPKAGLAPSSRAATPTPRPHGPSAVLELQRRAGNSAVSDLISRSLAQPALQPDVAGTPMNSLTVQRTPLTDVAKRLDSKVGWSSGSGIGGIGASSFAKIRDAIVA